MQAHKSYSLTHTHTYTETHAYAHCKITLLDTQALMNIFSISLTAGYFFFNNDGCTNDLVIILCTQAYRAQV